MLAPMLVTQLCCEDPVARLDAVGAVAARPVHIPLGVVMWVLVLGCYIH